MPRGDARSQRKRYRDRYRGCRVCGVQGAACVECGLGTQIVARYGEKKLAIVVDGSFVGPHHGGAGLVLVRLDDTSLISSRACGFNATSSTDAELQAVVRAARWAPGVAIYTDDRGICDKVRHFNPALDVYYFDPNLRGEFYALAHRLSVEGRCREAPETIPASGIEYAATRSGLTKGERKRRGVDILLEHAQRDPTFDGDFVALAERIGWTTGQFWRENPAIQVAAKRWKETK